MGDKLKGKPRDKIKSVAKPTFDTNKAIVSWTTKSGFDKGKYKTESYNVAFVVSQHKKGAKKGSSKKVVRKSITKLATTKSSHSFTRSAYYPEGKMVLESVSASVRPNNKSTVKTGWAKATASKVLPFVVPDAPKIGGISLNPDTSQWSCTITSPQTKVDSKGVHERFDCRYWAKIQVYTSSNKKTSDVIEHISPNRNKNDQFTIGKDLSTLAIGDRRGINSITFGDYVKLTVYAQTRGLAGNSKTVELKKPRYFSYPSAATIDPSGFVK